MDLDPLDRLGPVDLDGVPLADLARAHSIVGCAIGVSRRGERAVAVHGLADVDTAAPVERDTMFLAGSVTKAMTASLVALLADERRIDLDEPVRGWVPEFCVADSASAEAITVRHLLTHTSGFDGDVWSDVGEGDDAIARFVAAMGGLAQQSPPGQHFSYNNAGYSVLGRLVEVVEGAPFERVLSERIAVPASAGLTTDIGSIAQRPTASGYAYDARTSAAVPIEVVSGPACLAPAGSRTWATVDDLLGVGEWHLGRRGSAAEHRALVAMRAPQLFVADPNNAATMALGVFVDEQRWGTPVVFHDGGVSGHSAYLRIVPEDDAVLVVMTTGGVPQAFHRHVLRAMAATVLGRTAPLGARPDADVVLDLDRYVGTFANAVTEVAVERDDGRLSCTITYGPGTDTAVRTDRLPLSPVDHRVLLAPLGGRDYVLVFSEEDDPCDHVLAGLRMLVRR